MWPLRVTSSCEPRSQEALTACCRGRREESKEGLATSPVALSEFASTAESTGPMAPPFWAGPRPETVWRRDIKARPFLPSAEHSGAPFMLQSSPGGWPGCIKAAGRQLSMNIFIFSAWSGILEPRALANSGKSWLLTKNCSHALEFRDSVLFQSDLET